VHDSAELQPLLVEWLQCNSLSWNDALFPNQIVNSLKWQLKKHACEHMQWLLNLFFFVDWYSVLQNHNGIIFSNTSLNYIWLLSSNLMAHNILLSESLFYSPFFF
jgi:hypothetical protein